MSYITTYTKIHFDPLNPTPDDICLDDIAHALSMITRATGHFPKFYSVGQHSLNCCYEAEKRGLPKRTVLACLLHDAAECYISDVTRSVKALFPEYNRLEEKLLDIIYTKFLSSSITEEEASAVKEIDDTMLYHEFVCYMDEKLQPVEPVLYSKPDFSVRSFEDVENEFKEKVKILFSDILK